MKHSRPRGFGEQAVRRLQAMSDAELRGLVEHRCPELLDPPDMPPPTAMIPRREEEFAASDLAAQLSELARAAGKAKRALSGLSIMAVGPRNGPRRSSAGGSGQSPRARS